MWTYERPPNKNRDMQEVRSLYKEACKYVEDEQKAIPLITKGLKLNPRTHTLYALKGDIDMRQGRWTQAIKSYERARCTAKFDKKLSALEADILYNRHLVESYTKRGNWFFDNNLLLEATSDFEQVLALESGDTSNSDVQDKLLSTLKKLQKYEAFQHYWNQFILNVDNKRASILLTTHAEYKIHLRAMAAARNILYEALDLDDDNSKAQELLQEVYNAGHTFGSHTVMWCMHGCFDKALITIEKARDCDPYNPGYTVLKTIVLRLSGRLTQAVSWLDSINKGFNKLLERSRDKGGSIMGKLSLPDTRKALIEQWYLIRYDMAMKHLLNNEHAEAMKIIKACNLQKRYMESSMLLGDSFLKRGMPDLALKMYLRGRDFPRSRKTINLTERIINILHERAQENARNKRSKETISISNEILRILDEDEINIQELRSHRGDALLCKSRGQFQVSSKTESVEEPRKNAADSLRFLRTPEVTGLYRSLYGEIGMEKIIDEYAPKRKLPQSLKILMQYS